MAGVDVGQIWQNQFKEEDSNHSEGNHNFIRDVINVNDRFPHVGLVFEIEWVIMFACKHFNTWIYSMMMETASD